MRVLGLRQREGRVSHEGQDYPRRDRCHPGVTYLRLVAASREAARAEQAGARLPPAGPGLGRRGVPPTTPTMPP
ncbi:hypothetical protein KR76_00059 [Pimelobacter simplex]|uniref:Uncharacterized protein n=1 Tax=Nocardioides simplex TaxID=2045 RepID=A0A0C5XL41_NOCSI|nr:hypothetical protein KR76_00059 [Pimelobacter simplex]